jgi:SAM-dependent methyltransferase
MTDPCPLCGDQRADPVASVPYAEVWQALAGEIGRPVPDDLRSRYTPADNAVLVQCGTCGLQYFGEMNAGGPDFYEFLSGPGDYYFESNKWEFRRTARLLDRSTSVLDVGCGNGSFLREVAPTVGRAVGIDTNRFGVQRLVEEGLEAQCVTVDDFATDHAGAFDVVCMFQVIEHLDDISPFVLAAARCARSGGAVLISVPNRERVRLGGIDPYDFPPHHVSRWAPRDLEELGRRLDLDVVEVVAQRRTPASMGRAAPRLLRHLPTRLRKRGTTPSTTGPSTAPSSITERLRQFAYEHTMLARYRVR